MSERLQLGSFSSGEGAAGRSSHLVRPFPQKEGRKLQKAGVMVEVKGTEGGSENWVFVKGGIICRINGKGG